MIRGLRHINTETLRLPAARTARYNLVRVDIFANQQGLVRGLSWESRDAQSAQ